MNETEIMDIVNDVLADKTVARAVVPSFGSIVEVVVTTLCHVSKQDNIRFELNGLSFVDYSVAYKVNDDGLYETFPALRFEITE